MNEQMGEEQMNRRQSNPCKHFCCIIAIYFLLTLSNHVSSDNVQNHTELQDRLQKNQTSDISTSKIFESFTKAQYEGGWESENVGIDNFLYHGSGKFLIRCIKTTAGFHWIIYIKNGQYIDDGQLGISFDINKTQWTSVPGNHSVSISATTNKTINYKYQLEQIFSNRGDGDKNLSNTEFNLILSLTKENTLKQKIQITLDDQKLNLAITNEKSRIFGLIILVVIFYFLAYAEITSFLSIFRSFFQGTQNPSHYSFLTILIATLWDLVLCILAFGQSFSEQDNLILFIIPGFIFCWLSTNLELRLLFLVFRQGNDDNNRRVFCQFNLVTYCCLFATFPIIILTNMNNWLFVLVSFMFIPQIYTNAAVNKRPNPLSTYYNYFLLARFLLIIYLRCFPFNVFQLRPNYFLGLACLTIISFQFVLLWIQKIYGPKKVIPRCLLPPIYDYSFDGLEFQLQDNLECAICLGNLNQDPPQETEQVQSVPPSKIMKTPCGHIYHGTCLASWMKVKLECPNCRAKLPLYD